MYQKSGKRIFDIILAASGLIILMPLFVLITTVLWFHFRGKPLFCQGRPGKNERIFTLFKFRSMYDRTGPGSAGESRIGNLLRKTSLDELPQLWNVVRGDMSLVGPRPLLIEYLPFYTKHQSRRHAVLPGITGMAQINGRNTLSWDEKFAYDLWYVENQSFWVDLKILSLTIKKVAFREGVDPSAAVSVAKFKGAPEV
jgi:lipopolysaccharide/colanic/teichoic acid biosynthesis glycosyltransferase